MFKFVNSALFLVFLLAYSWRERRKQRRHYLIAVSAFEGLSGMDNSPQAQALRAKTNALWDDSEHPDDR